MKNVCDKHQVAFIHTYCFATDRTQSSPGDRCEICAYEKEHYGKSRIKKVNRFVEEYNDDKDDR